MSFAKFSLTAEKSNMLPFTSNWTLQSNQNDEITSVSLRYEENADISTEKKDMCDDSELSQKRTAKQEDEHK